MNVRCHICRFDNSAVRGSSGYMRCGACGTPLKIPAMAPASDDDIQIEFIDDDSIPLAKVYVPPPAPPQAPAPATTPPSDELEFLPPEETSVATAYSPPPAPPAKPPTLPPPVAAPPPGQVPRPIPPPLPQPIGANIADTKQSPRAKGRARIFVTAAVIAAAVGTIGIFAWKSSQKSGPGPQRQLQTIVTPAPTPTPVPAPIPSRPPVPSASATLDERRPVKLARRRRPPPPVDKEIELPDTPDDVCEGGAGRFLFLTFLARKEIAIFDAQTRAIVKTLRIEANDFACAAGIDFLVVAELDTQRLWRVDLKSLSIDKSTRAELGQSPDSRSPAPNAGGPLSRRISAAMGSASSGPLLVSTEFGENTSVLCLYDVETLAPLKAPTFAKRPDYNAATKWMRNAMPAVISASADGATFCGLPPSQNSDSIFLLKLLPLIELKDVRLRSQVTFARPDSNGGSIFSDRGDFLAKRLPFGAIRLDSDDPVWRNFTLSTHAIQPAGQKSLGDIFIPAQRTPFVIGISILPPGTGLSNPPLINLHEEKIEGRRVMAAPLYVSAGTSSIRSPISLPATPELTSAALVSGEMQIDRRIHWFIDWNFLLVIPPSQLPEADTPDRLPDQPKPPNAVARPAKLIVHGFNFDSCIGAFESNVPLLDAQLPAEFHRGQSWKLQLYGSNDNVTCRLVAARGGMTLTDAGILQWDVPADFGDVGAMGLECQDSSGRREMKTVFFSIR